MSPALPPSSARGDAANATVRSETSSESLRFPRVQITGSTNAQLARIADASVKLAALGPRLATLAGEMEQQAQLQAQRAATIATTMDALSRDLELAVAELRASSGQMHTVLRTVERIADHTRLLSINASIEAARAGEHGRAFGVVVDEVQRLADSSGENTKLIEERMSEIDTSVMRVAAVTVDNPDASSGEAARTVASVNHEVRGMAESANQQLGSAASVHSMGDQINGLTESLLLTVGKFRFEAHGQAQAAVQRLLPELVRGIGSRIQLERSIEKWLEGNSYFELGYITDAAGVQLTDNLVSREGRVSHDSAGLGRDWSSRPWFREALQHRSVASTDVYRSAATRDFCFTVTAALHDPEGNLIGVFGSDVNFQKLISQ